MKVTVTGPGLGGSYVVAEQRADGTLVLSPETSAEVIEEFSGRPLGESDVSEALNRLEAALELEMRKVTSELPDSVYAEMSKLSREHLRALARALQLISKALRHKPPDFPAELQVKGVEGHPGIFEMSFAPDGRATFEYRDAVATGQADVLWRRVGDHSILLVP